MTTEVTRFISQAYAATRYNGLLLYLTLTISCIWFRDSRGAPEIACSTDENCSATTGWNSKLSTDCKADRDNAPSPYLRKDSQLHVTKIT